MFLGKTSRKKGQNQSKSRFMQVVAFNGSARKKSNRSILVQQVFFGVGKTRDKDRGSFTFKRADMRVYLFALQGEK
jgi:hypothetical protein